MLYQYNIAIGWHLRVASCEATKLHPRAKRVTDPHRRSRGGRDRRGVFR